MDPHHCEVVIVTCIDFRFQDYITNWIEEHYPDKTYDRVALAGGVFDFEAILKQIEISQKLHHTKKAILVNHENCGAYGESGIYEKHKSDLQKAREEIKKKIEGLGVDCYYLHLDGNFEKI